MYVHSSEKQKTASALVLLSKWLGILLCFVMWMSMTMIHFGSVAGFHSPDLPSGCNLMQ